ncbi:hypothetical protein VMT65_21915 [Nocardia sp. CDC153]|uniref:hypothetical protein n=1 Tax=Nocardia sp. CDC153 TaxID=3112167 RepID=UPI002DBB5713|nr:hypothetical protein [Nocardia sp. CDC153]MEC3955709.1 hypothetical protein [Nocardia sp. CDC153]
MDTTAPRNKWVIWRYRHAERWVRFADGQWYADEETAELFNSPNFAYRLIELGPILYGRVMTESEAFTAARDLFGSFRYVGTPPPPPRFVPPVKPGWRY